MNYKSTDLDNVYSSGMSRLFYYTKEEAIKRFGFPIGGIFKTIRTDNPEDMLGYGKWKKINTYLIGVAHDDASKEIVGANQIIIKEENLAPHIHEVDIMNANAHNHEMGHSHSLSISPFAHNHPIPNASMVQVAKGSSKPIIQQNMETGSTKPVESILVKESAVIGTGTSMGSSAFGLYKSAAIENETTTTGNGQLIELRPITFTIYQWERIE